MCETCSRVDRERAGDLREVGTVGDRVGDRSVRASVRSAAATRSTNVPTAVLSYAQRYLTVTPKHCLQYERQALEFESATVLVKTQYILV